MRITYLPQPDGPSKMRMVGLAGPGFLLPTPDDDADASSIMPSIWSSWSTLALLTTRSQRFVGRWRSARPIEAADKVDDALFLLALSLLLVAGRDGVLVVVAANWLAI